MWPHACRAVMNTRIMLAAPDRYDFPRTSLYDSWRAVRVKLLNPLQAVGGGATLGFPSAQGYEIVTHIATLVCSALYWLSPQGRAAVDALLESDGRRLDTRFIASRAGLRNRHQLARLFQREGLPSVEETAAWTQVLSWVFAWEARGQSLGRSALAVGRDPAVCYRVVRRLTGLRWREIRDLGTASALLRLRDRCREPSAELRQQARGLA